MILALEIEYGATRSAGGGDPVPAGGHTVETVWEPDGHMVTATCTCGAWLARTCFWSDRTAREQVERTVLADLHERRSESSRRRRPR